MRRQSSKMASMNQSPNLNPAEENSAAGAAAQRTFPDPSLTLVEFGDGVGVLIAARTERDAANKRVVLKKVGYVRLTPDGWGASAVQEIWVGRNEQGLFTATDAASGRLFRYPSRRRYEVAFISQELFETAIQSIKQRTPGALYELIAVTFAGRGEFELEEGALVGPDDYSNEPNLIPPDQLIPFPPPMSR